MEIEDDDEKQMRNSAFPTLLSHVIRSEGRKEGKDK